MADWNETHERRQQSMLYERRMLSIINEHGVAIQGVGGDEDFPSFAYTVGLAAHQHPEFILVALPMATSQTLLNNLASNVLKSKVTFSGGDIVHNLVQGFAVRLVDVTDSSELLTMSNAIYGDGVTALPALQVCYPDVAGRWPWDTGSQVAQMPLLGPAPLDATGNSVHLDG